MPKLRLANRRGENSTKDQKKEDSSEEPRLFTISPDYLFLICAGILLLMGMEVFRLVPATVHVEQYQTPVMTFICALVLGALANIVVGWVQKGVSHQTVIALNQPLMKLDREIEELRQIHLFHKTGVVGVFPNRSSALPRFARELDREDSSIDLVGTSLLGCLDPTQEDKDKMSFRNLLQKRKENGARIRVLLMHPAYGEFRDRVEGRAPASVAGDIQKTLKFLLPYSESSVKRPSTENDSVGIGAIQKLLQIGDVRLYPGVVTAQAIFTSRCMLVNIGSLHGKAYDNLTVIVEDRTDDPSSIFKRFKANHFSEPWQSENTITLTHELLVGLLNIDFSTEEHRFREGDWPPTIPEERARGQH